MMDWSRIAITDGTWQRDRQPPAIEPGYFNVDELSFEDLLAMGAEIAAGMQFYNLENEVDGNWAPLFEADEAVIMAKIMSTDLARIEFDYRHIKSSRPQQLYRFILELAARINHWFERLSASRHESGELLARKIATIITDKLSPEFHNICKIADQAGALQDSTDFSGFAVTWGLGERQGDNPFPRSTIGDLDNADDINRQLNASFYTFSSAISYIKTTAAMILQQSLESEQHDPAIGLFMVFLKLYEKAQDQLNRFTPRHLEFYYRQVLKINNREPVAEHRYLLCEPLPGSGTVRVPKDTRFSAGKNAESQQIVYYADEDLLVSDVRLEALATLYLQHDKLISPEAELGLVTRLKTDLPPVSTGDMESEMTQSRPRAWPLFGAGQPGDGSGTASDARIGLSVASVVLMLAEGNRKVELSIELAATEHSGIEEQVASLLKCDSAQVFSKQFRSLFARYLLSFKGCLSSQQVSDILHLAGTLLPGHMAQEIATLLEQDWQGLFYALFKKVFSIRLTTENGWLEVTDYILMPYSQVTSPQKTGLRIAFNLGQDVAPITAYNADLHGGQLDTELPVLQCEINSQSHFCPYSIFQNLVIASLTIDVEVSGVRDLQAHNQHGQLDPSKPFQPFGPTPGSNSYLVFGNYELARKQLRELQINLDWAELPAHPGGFEEYYHGYETTYGNSAFKGEFCVLSDSRWIPDDPLARERFKLFDSVAEGNRVAAKKALRIDNLDSARSLDAGVSAAEFKYDLRTRSGFFRVALTEPQSAFGHGEYPQLLSAALSANARRKKPEPVPNPPYTPVLNGISLSYKATTTINPSQQGPGDNRPAEKIFHLHPLGVETVFPSETGSPCFLLPQYAHEGNLFIGLSGQAVAGPLSLLFHFSQDVTTVTTAPETVFDWFYLAANQWKKLPVERLLSDTTHGFLTSGKITVDIPADIDAGNSIMPGEYFWLRVSVSQSANAFPACHSLQLHAVQVSQRSGELNALSRDSAPPVKWTSIQPLVGIGSIKQAYWAFGGRARESDSEHRIRVGERLRHKNRALIPHDYEELVLEKFPEINKVKCFNSISSKHDAIRPGHVLIVVVPGERNATGKACAGAMINTQKLEQIRSYVKNLSPVFTCIEVRNPLYEKVQVRCTVKFVDAVGAGVNINRLNQHISDYICPWKTPGYKARFGWSIRQQDIESYIRSLDYVEFVTNFSMLHITVDRDGNYSLYDSALGGQKRDAAIRPRYPWGLAIPAEKHFIEITPLARPIGAEVTGVGELAVGSTLIISGSSEYGEEE